MPLPYRRADYHPRMRLPVWILLSLLLFAQAEAAKKNVVFILVDDWGWADAELNSGSAYPRLGVSNHNIQAALGGRLGV